MKHVVAIVTPLYKKIPLASEVAALKHSFEVLADHQKFVVAPDTLDVSGYGNTLDGCVILRLNDKHFESVAAYSRLLLSKYFYQQFLPFEYVLILQPDTFVFRDDLDYWCELGFDYIGAPWPSGEVTRPYSFRGDHLIARLLPCWNKPIRKFVGNGGLSLRKVSAALSTLDNYWLRAKIWIGNEDMFWSLYSPNVPEEKQASLFALEENPSSYYKANRNRLPFGCHAWEKHEPEFWRTQFELSGDSKIISLRMGREER